VDYAANARSLGAHALKAGTLDELKQALEQAKTLDRTTVIVVETDASQACPATNPGGMLRLPKFLKWTACARPGTL
jgi:TPP-dependent trihydroxycyclohexane-1,2-dione (THcHDO) dehydratase